MSQMELPLPDPITQMFLDIIDGALLRPVRTLEKWMEEEIVLPDGPFEGMRFSWDRQPVHRLIAREIDSGRWSEIFVTGPSQSGKTLISFCAPLLYHMTEMGESLVQGVPEARMADDKFKVDLLPVMKASPRLEALIPETGPGSQGGVVRDTILFRNGARLKIMTVGGRDTSKAGYTARVVVVTEAAGFSKVSGASKEATALKQLQARQRAFGDDKRLYVEGTVTVEEDLPWSAREDSSESRIVSECPWCGNWVLPEREHLRGFEEAKTSGEAGRLVYWCCPECGQKINDEMRRDMVRNARIIHVGQKVVDGKVVGEYPDTDRFWIRYNAWHNIMSLTTEQLGREEWRAQKIDPDDPEWEDVEKERCQFVWAMPYKPKVIEREPLHYAVIQQRRDEIPRGVVPEDTTHLACGVDIGMNLCWYVVLAGRENGGVHYVSYGPLDVPSRDLDLEIAIDSTLRDLWHTLQTGYVHQNNPKPMVPQATWIDIGWEPDKIVPFCRWAGSRSRKGLCHPIFGRGSGQLQEQYHAPRKRSKQSGIIEIGNHWHMQFDRERRTMVSVVDADYWKKQIHYAFYLEPGKPGAMTLYQAPKIEHKQLSKHIANEQWVVAFEPGRGEVGKFHRKGPNHLLDASAYARAALDRLGFKSAAASG